MQLDLKSIFNAITPENLKDVPVLAASMDIFISLLEEVSRESIDISSFSENPRIRKELVKTYISDLYNVLDGINSNHRLIELIEKKNAFYKDSTVMGEIDYISRSVLQDVLDNINDEHFMTFRAYREKKGTFSALEYIYTLITNIITPPEQGTFKATESGTPFDYSVEGPLDAVIYQYVVKPLAHPHGFVGSYSKVIEWELVDYFFPVEITYKVNLLEVVCLFEDPDNPGEVITKRTDFTDREVIHMEEDNSIDPAFLRIFFGGEHEGEYLEQLEYASGKITVQLLRKEEDDSITVLNGFSEHCSINKDILKEITVKPDLKMPLLTEVWWYFTQDRDDGAGFDKYPTYDNDQDDEDGIDDGGLDFRDAKHQRMPFLDWMTIPFWEYIGSFREGASFIIGDVHTYIWHKPERYECIIEDYSNFDPDKFNTPDPGGRLIERRQFYGKDTVQYNPRYWTMEDGYLEGDAYYVTHRPPNSGYQGELPYYTNHFHERSDWQFDFKVIRGDTVLPDNNISIEGYAVVSDDLLVDGFDVNAVFVI